MKINKLVLSDNYYQVWRGLDKLTSEEFDEMMLRILVGPEKKGGNEFSNDRENLINFLNRIEETYKELTENKGLSVGNGWFGNSKIEGIRFVIERFIEVELENYEEDLEKEMKEWIEEDLMILKP